MTHTSVGTGRWLTFLALAALAGAMVVPAPQAHAAPFNYLEVVDGELPPSLYTGSPSFGDIAPEPKDLGPVDVGANTVSGTTASDPGGSPDTDRDGFKFDVPVGVTVDSIFISIAQADLSESQTLRFDLYGPSGFADPFEWKPIGDTIVTVLAGNPANGALFAIPGGPLTAPGPYAIIVFNAENSPNPVAGELIYTVTLTVTPEPGTAAVLACGAAALMLRRRQV